MRRSRGRLWRVDEHTQGEVEEIVGGVDAALSGQASALFTHQSAHDPGETNTAVAVLFPLPQQLRRDSLRHRELGLLHG